MVRNHQHLQLGKERKRTKTKYKKKRKNQLSKYLKVSGPARASQKPKETLLRVVRNPREGDKLRAPDNLISGTGSIKKHPLLMPA